MTLQSKCYNSKYLQSYDEHYSHYHSFNNGCCVVSGALRGGGCGGGVTGGLTATVVSGGCVVVMEHSPSLRDEMATEHLASTVISTPVTMIVAHHSPSSLTERRESHCLSHSCLPVWHGVSHVWETQGNR